MSFIELDDTGFQCVASGIGGNLIPEHLDIIECCQDPDNLNIIYVRCTIAGIYLYTPNVTLTWDGNTVDVSSFFIPNYKGVGLSSFPIDTGCASITVLLAYNVGSLIPNFASISNVTVNVKFNGQLGNQNFSSLVQSAGVFISTNPEASVALDKGLTPKPYRLYFDSTTNELKIQYSNLGGTSCKCAINCVTPSSSDYTLTVCKDEIQEIGVSATTIFGDPTTVNITFADTIGNITNAEVYAMVNVEPKQPTIFLETGPSRINVTIPFITVNGTPVDSTKIKYQVLRYENNPDNFKVWLDWTDQNWKSLYDRNIRSGRTYGYAVRFQGQFGEYSLTSTWSTVQA